MSTIDDERRIRRADGLARAYIEERGMDVEDAAFRAVGVLRLIEIIEESVDLPNYTIRRLAELEYDERVEQAQRSMVADVDVRRNPIKFIPAECGMMLTRGESPALYVSDREIPRLLHQCRRQLSRTKRSRSRGLP